jgi:protein involved in polysaccharide export with SLBB domain
MMNNIEWLRRLKSDPEVLSFSVDGARMFVDGNLPQYNVELKHGDIIFLEAPERRVRIEGTARQGEFELLEGETMVELLILAGHISDSRADLRNVTLDRYVDGELRRAVFDLKPAGSEAAYLRDMLLEDGDVIRITPQIQQVFVMGEVNRPGVITYKQTWTVFDYLAQAGSWTPAGHEKFIAIIHHPRDLHTPCLESDMCIVNWPKFYEKEVPMSYVVLPGDVIYVPPKGEKINFSTVTSAINTLFLGVNFFNDLNTGGGTKEEPEPTPTE